MEQQAEKELREERMNISNLKAAIDDAEKKASLAEATPGASDLP